MVCVDRDRDIPLPIVHLNRWVLVVGVVGGLILRQPLLTTALFLVVLSAVLFGRRGSLIFQAGRLLLAKRNAKALSAGEVEDPRLMRFNNTLAGGGCRGRCRPGGLLRRLLLLLPLPSVPFSGVWEGLEEEHVERQEVHYLLLGTEFLPLFTGVSRRLIVGIPLGLSH
jgi:hypothetical protein